MKKIYLISLAISSFQLLAISIIPIFFFTPPNKEDAEDVVMDSVCKIVKHISKFLGADRNKTESLIVLIVRNTAINRYHYNQHRQHIPMEEYSNMIPDDSGSPSEILIE